MTRSAPPAAATPPPRIPAGLVVQLHRGRIRAGMGEQADEWMRMLNERHEEARATLDRERMAVELVFRMRDGDDDALYWVTIRGAGGQGVDSSDHPLDRDHLAFDERVRERGWLMGTIELVLMPSDVEHAVVAWATA